MVKIPHTRAGSQLLPLLPACLLLLHGLLVWVHLSAGANTSFCYARTLAEGYGPALQPGAVWSLGFASAPWVLLLAGAERAGLSMVLVAKGLGLALTLVALYLLPRVSRALGGRRRLGWVDLLPSVLLAVNPAVARAAVGGQETGLTLALLTATLWLFVLEERRLEAGARPRDLWSALPLILLLFNRPEAPVWFLALAVWRIMARATARRLHLSTVAWLALPLLVYLGQLLGAYALFAEPLSGLITARQALVETTPGHPAAVALGWRSLVSLWDAWGWGLPLAAVAAVGACRALAYWGRSALLAFGLINAAVVVAVGGDRTGELLLPSLLAGSLLAAAGLDTLLARQPAQDAAGARWGRLITVALVVGLAAPAAQRGLASMIGPVQVSVMESPLRRLEEFIQELGLEPQQVKVLTTRPGDAAWHGFQVVDASGLTDPAIRRYNTSRRNLELQRIIFRERRPDVIFEEGLWKVIHALGAYPEARRQFVSVPTPGHQDLRASLSRELLLEPEPLVPRLMHLDLGGHLTLVGARPEPGRLVLLWSARRKLTTEHRVTLRLGDKLLPLQVGPTVYRPRRWRPGEVVRQVVPVPPMPARRLSLSIRHRGRWYSRSGLDGGVLNQDHEQWLQGIKTRLKRRGEALVELIPTLTRNPAIQPGETSRRIQGRAEALVRRNLLGLAARQLHLIRHMRSPDVRRLTETVAADAYARARALMARSGWSAAFRLLQAAAVADPGCPWIARRREEARQRLPASSHFVKELELELARRAMVLAPSEAALDRVLVALLALGQYEDVVAAATAWMEHARQEHAPRVAEAMYRLGWLDDAWRMIAAPPRPLQDARCPPAHLVQAAVLHEELQRDLARPPSPGPLERALEARGPALGAHSSLLARCVRWGAGEPLTVDLYVLQRAPERLELELKCGPRRQQISLATSSKRLRRIRKRFALPPASYRARLTPRGGAALDLDAVVVGPEATFGFELPSFATWQRQGTAFGRAPVLGRGFRGRRLFGYVGERFADSFSSGFDRPTGQLKSPAFRLRKGYLMLLVAGGDDPALGVDLVVAGRVVARVKGRRSEVMRAVFIPVARYRGRRARVVVRDRDAKVWGHIAVDEIRQVDGPAVGVAP